MGISYKNENGIVTLTMNIGENAVNTLEGVFAHAFADAVSRLADEPELKGVILTSAKMDFMSGADIDELHAITDPQQAMDLGLAFKQTARRLETLGKPVVAAVNGSALGGGYEVALCCHYRIALANPKLRIGFPEVTLGLFPGGGGTQRLPRMIGIQAALPHILEGRLLDVEAAAKAGLVDAIASDTRDMIANAKTWIEAHPDATQPWDRKGFRWPGGSPNSPAILQLWVVAPSMINEKTRDNYPAQRHAMASVYEGSLVDFDTASRIESRYFSKTVCGQVAKNMVGTFWYQMNHIKKGGSRPPGEPRSRVTKVGVLGAGMMGAGIAYVAASRGVEVVLKDVTREKAEHGKTYSVGLLEKKLAKGRTSAEKKKLILSRIQPTSELQPLHDCDLIIEAVFEDRALKAKVTGETEVVIPANTVFASNTSTLPITGLAEASIRPDQFIGLHFFSPVDKMQLVEIIVGDKTSEQTLARAFDFVLQIGKVPIVVNDRRGFYTSRVFSTYINEGMAMLQEGIHPRAIEAAGLKAGMPVGPLALTDEVNMGLIMHIFSQTKKDLGEDFQPHPAHEVVHKMVDDLGRPGKKNGRGFYDYPEQESKRLWSGLAQAFPQTQGAGDQQECIDRFLFVQALETVHCYQEKVVCSVADANIGSILGWGFAPFHGGTLQFVNAVGLNTFIKRASQLAAKYGARFEPSALLRQMADKGEQF